MTWNTLCPYYTDSTVIDVKNSSIVEDARSIAVKIAMLLVKYIHFCYIEEINLKIGKECLPTV